MRGAHDGRGVAAAVTHARPGQRLRRRRGRDDRLRAGRCCGGPRSRPSRTRRAASSGSTRAPGCSSRGRSAWPPAGRATVTISHAVSTTHDRAAEELALDTAWPRSRRRRCPSRPWRPREPRPARRPRPLLPAVAGRSVQRRGPAGPDRRAGPRLDRPDQRRVLPAQRGARATSAGCRGTSGRPSPAGWSTATRSPIAGSSTGDRGVNGLAQPFHHTILPLASAADRRTEIRWGLRDFALAVRPAGAPGCGCRRARSTWRRCGCSPSTASSTRSWRRGRRATSVETRRPYRVELGDGRSIVVALYDGALSAAISFDPRATADADRFIAEDVVPRLASGSLPDDEPPLVVIATDGELYGHHQPFRELFLQRLFQPVDAGARGFDIVPLAEALREPAGQPFRSIRIAERTSWSCHHGVLRWSGDCPCAADGTLEGSAASRARAPSGGHRRRHRAGDAARWPPRPTRGRRAMRTSTSSSARKARPGLPDAGWARARSLRLEPSPRTRSSSWAF